VARSAAVRVQTLAPEMRVRCEFDRLVASEPGPQQRHEVPFRLTRDRQIQLTEQVGRGCKIGPNVSIGALCKIGDGVRLSNCVLLHRVEVWASGLRVQGAGSGLALMSMLRARPNLGSGSAML